MIHDQADELRHLVRQRALAGSPAGPAVPLVVTSGGMRGVGTSTIAVNLAVALARQGRRALFVDADLEHGGKAQLSQNAPRGSMLDVLAGRRTVHEVLERGPSGVQVLTGAWATPESTVVAPAAQQRFVTELKHLAPHAEVVVIDAGNGRGAFARGLWQAADVVIVVTTAEANSITECYAAMKVLLTADALASIYTLVNQQPDATGAADVQARIAEACRKFLGRAVTSAGYVPPCETRDSKAGLLIYPDRTESARTLDRVADTLWTQLQVASNAAARESSSRRRSA